MTVRNFRDEFGLIHVEEEQASENGVLFAAEYYLARYLSGTMDLDDYQSAIKAVESTIMKTEEGLWYNPNPADPNDAYSHMSNDNISGLYSIMVLLNFSIDNMPVLKWNCVKKKNQHKLYYRLQKKLFGNYLWLHPRDVAFYSVLKYGERKWMYLLLPFVFLFLVGSSLVSASSSRNKTSGKMLWWLRISVLKERFKKCNKVSILLEKWQQLILTVLKKSHGDKPYIDISRIYFKQQYQPTRKSIEKLYEH